MMMNREKKIARLLLQSKAINLNPAKPFTWASGWKSPIYCDNRKTLSFPEIRTAIRDEFLNLINEKFNNVEAIAGVATGGIPHGMLVADALNLPYMYVRSSAKSHGLENLVEGSPVKGQRIVVIEDLISTGSSSINAVNALRNAGMDVLGMMAIFTYGFKQAEENLKKANCQSYTLSNYECLLEMALESGDIKKEQMRVLQQWRQAPQLWKGLVF